MSIEALARAEIVAMKPYSSARKEAPGRGVLMNANESPWSLLENTGLNRYPDPQPAQLVAKLAALYDAPQDHILVTRGSDEGIDLLTRVFCRAGQDAILQCPPNFGMYRIAAQTQGAGIISVPRLPGFQLDIEGVLERLRQDDSIRLVFLTSPNNPTGDVIEPEVLVSVLEAARDRAVVVVDEAYAEFCKQPSASRLVAENEHLVVLRTLSKAWAAAGLRCGTVIAQPVVISLLRRIIAPYPLPSPVVELALRMLEEQVLGRQQSMLREIAANKKILLSLLENRGFIHEILPGEANFVLIRPEQPDELLSWCAQHKVILRGFPADPDLQDWIRISVGSEADIAALNSALDAWEKQA